MTDAAYLNLGQARRRLGSTRGETPVHPATLVRWITTGVRLGDGSRLRLRAVKLPGGWRTTAEWLDEFIERLTRDRLGDRDPHAPPARRRRSHAAAEATLDAAGF